MRDERRHSACPHVDMHRQALGYLVPWTYINQEVSLPEPVLDLPLISSQSGTELPPHIPYHLSLDTVCRLPTVSSLITHHTLHITG